MLKLFCISLLSTNALVIVFTVQDGNPARVQENRKIYQQSDETYGIERENVIDIYL